MCRRGSSAFPKGTVKDGTPIHQAGDNKKKLCIEGIERVIKSKNMDTLFIECNTFTSIGRQYSSTPDYSSL